MTARGLAASLTGWDQLAHAVAERIPPAEVDAIWTFAPLRRGANEWGTAVVSRIEGDRRRIYTARYTKTIRGKERGKFEATIQEVGTGPVEVLSRVLQDAQHRTDDDHPPIAVPPSDWFAALPADAAGSNGPPG
jgi:hypothetical protein